MGLSKGYEGRLTLLLPGFIALLLAGFSANADEIIMKDGSRLLGKVVNENSGDAINFETSYAGVIKVKWAEVSELIVDEPVTVLLESGETRKMKSAKNTETGLQSSSESGVVETFSVGEVAQINPEPWRLGEGLNWSGNVNVVLKRERGNSDKDEYDADFATTFRRLENRLKFYGDYDREESNGDLTDDDWRLNGRYDRFVNKKFYYGGTLGLEHDRFADLRLRTMVGPLVGYEFYESQAMNLDAAVGPLWVKEDFYAAENDDYMGLGWMIDFDRFLIPDRVQFYHRQNGLLQFDDTDNLVWNAWTGFRFPIYAGIVATTEVKIEYDGGTPVGLDDTETTYNIKLGYQW
ncbi:MAG: hypothetical protein DRQ60_01680 [Gammaproteobacteria bacterium]|nr:MAG: hypothetical protein DRQ54_01180 [Gammaproteobacteria bacterium]RLA15458.1 MAG: hypothetical protein DRQ52_01790 [Gammaproteobacteria bacterium]RLA17561.1 MAG: hypothetical protein DRQ60_01680 [Gammaproteobacteria bacterium]